MAGNPPSDITGEMRTAMRKNMGPKPQRLKAVSDVPEPNEFNHGGPESRRDSREVESARRTEIFNLKMAGLSTGQIADRLKLNEGAVQQIVRNSARRLDPELVEEMRYVENLRLDRAQAAVWARVLQGDDDAIKTFLGISQRRAKLNGLDAPTKIDLNVSIRQEMEAALAALEAVVLGDEVITGEVIDSHDYDVG